MKNATGTFTNTSSGDVTTLVTGLSSIYKKPNLAMTCMKNGTRVYQYIQVAAFTSNTSVYGADCMSITYGNAGSC